MRILVNGEGAEIEDNYFHSQQQKMNFFIFCVSFKPDGID
jgi:hypothetical protein